MAASGEPEKVDLASPDLAAGYREALAAAFPGVLADGVLDVPRLAELLDVDVAGLAEGRERYGLMWAGKSEAVRSLLTPSHATLVPDFERSIDFDTAQNVFIEGDNLEVLKLLQKAYNDKVKLIYIDPPYNTGNDFVYNDDFSDGLRGYLEYTGQVDDEGNRTSANAETQGRRHSKWLSMMYPRLVLARNILRQDGVLAVSIDDNEVHALRQLLDEVFGRENFVTSVAWQSRTSVQNDTDVSVSHEYLLLYARNRRKVDRRLKESNADRWFDLPSFAAFPKPADPQRYSNPDADERGPWKADPFDAPNVRPNLTYAVVNPNTGEEHWPPNGRCWRTGEAEFKRLSDDGRIVWGKSGAGRPALKVFYEEKKAFGEVESTWWDGSTTGTATSGTKELQAMFGGRAPFDTPKPTTLLRRLLALTTRDDDLVVDFFAGSATTGHAVFLANAADGGHRRVLLVNLDEPVPVDSAASEMGFTTVAEVGIARIMATFGAVEGARSGGLRVFELEPSAFVRRDESVSGDQLDLVPSTLLNDECEPPALAAECFLAEGVTLDQPWSLHDANGGPAFVAGGVAVVAHARLDDAVVAASLALGSRVVVFLEDAFAGKDALKANAVVNAKNRGITMKTV